MGYQPLERLLPRSGGSVYKLILLGAKRATELADGAPPLVDFATAKKTTTVALDEIMIGRVETKEVAETRQSGEKVKGKKKDKEKEKETAGAI